MKRRLIAVGSTIVIGLGIVTITHTAHAAEAGCDPAGDGSVKIVNPCPKDEAMKLCKGSLKINGKQQFASEFAQTFPADTCDFRVTEVLGADDAKPIFGEPFSPSKEVANCPPNTNKNLSFEVAVEQGAAKIAGDFVDDGDSFSASFVNLLGAEWGEHGTESSLTTEVRTVTTARTVNVPEGKKGTFQFIPRRAQIKGLWTVTGGTRNSAGGGPFGPENTPWEWSFETTIDAPLLLPSGNPDGEARPKLTDCTGDEFKDDDPQPFPPEPTR
ncbi:hypothetical protein [Micromonospora sp. KC213]|uniref:hypothetical protein n=1 Tax=Micromonospora sp. KC213 TaxID=2530378 RepID=UPI0010521661|nr:hypothetical protein [Micromonospora sp. KC213]TDC31955.1 hypothetical protein E1166_27305 [Micromonospora sp. KC213]